GGQRDRAIRTYDTCRSILRREFAIDVSPETRALWQSMMSAATPAATSVHVEPANDVPAGRWLGRPSISVADFANLTGERGDDFFAKGLVQDITTALSEVADYIVLSDRQPMENKSLGDDTKIPGARRARYVLSGSIQRSGDGLRVNVQLGD